MTRREQMIIAHEGFRRHIYTCTAGRKTIGYGFNLEAGVTEDEAFLLLQHRLNLLDEQLAYTLPFYTRLSAVRQDVLCDMAYNLGLAGLLKFRKMLAAVERSAWDMAAYEMLNSRWATQVGKRAEELAFLMRTGTDTHS